MAINHVTDSGQCGDFGHWFIESVYDMKFSTMILLAPKKVRLKTTITVYHLLISRLDPKLGRSEVVKIVSFRVKKCQERGHKINKN